MFKHAPNNLFDVRQSNSVSNDLALKTCNFEARGIKSMCIFNNYLAVASFNKTPTKNAPLQRDIDLGFKPNAGNMAADFIYHLDLYKLPSHYTNSELTKANWKEYINF